MQIDPELSRTVIVSTKLDTKILQFARSSDVEVFLSPPACTLDGFILGDSPFFTSVPSGRVGSGPDSVYISNDEFKQVFCLTTLSSNDHLLFHEYVSSTANSDLNFLFLDVKPICELIV